MLNLILASVQSILQVVVTVAFGFLMAKAGFFASDKQKWLSQVNLTFLTPCLLFYNISSVISFSKLLEYWPIPAFFIIILSLSYWVGRLISWTLGLSEPHTRFVLASSMFPNTNSLPVAVIASLASSEIGKMLRWGEDDTSDSIAARGLSYAMFFGIFSNLLNWSWGYNLLRDNSALNQDMEVKQARGQYGAIPVDAENQASGSNASPLTFHPDAANAGDTSRSSSEVTLLLSSSAKPSDGNAWTKLSRRLSWIKGYMSPPIYGALLALVVGLIPVLKELLHNRQGFLYPSFTSAIEACGRASVPITLLCLGAQLMDIMESTMDDSSSGYKAVWAAIVSRMLLVPTATIGVVILFILYSGHWAVLSEDPVFSIAMIIMGSTPTAINLIQITQATGAFEEEMLQVLFWSYAVVCVPVLTLIIFAGLSVVDKLI